MLRSLAKGLIRQCGLEVRRAASAGKSFPANPFDAQRVLLDGMQVTKPTIFDIGAHRGETVEEYTARFPHSTIYCFEPYPESAAGLRACYHKDARVRVVPLALADRRGQKRFYVNELDATSSLLPRPKNARRYYPKKAGPKSTIEVDVSTIDDFTDSLGICSIDILKLDIQGGELLALQGAVKSLTEQMARLIYSETMFVPHYEGDPMMYELWSFLAEYGYTLFDVYHLRRAANGQLRFGDALFVSAGVREMVVDAYEEEP